MSGRRHSPFSQRQGEKNVYQRIDNHVHHDSVQAVEAFLVVLSKGRRLFHLTPEVEEHDAVQKDGAKFGKENPYIVSLESLILGLWAEPALLRVSTPNFHPSSR